MSKKIKIIIKNIIYRLVFRSFYYVCCVKWGIISKRVLCIEERYLEASTKNFEQMIRQLSEKGYEIQWAVLARNQVSRMHYFVNVFRMLKQLARAEYVLLDESDLAISYLNLRKETMVIQLWHGCGAFKKFGYSLKPELQEGYYSNYNLVTVSSPEVVTHFCDAMHLKKGTVRPTGVSRTDYFFDSSKQENARKKLEMVTGKQRGKKIILYAPTFRGNVDDARLPILFQISDMYSALSENYIIVFKAHPAIKEKLSIDEKYQNFLLDVTELMMVEELICGCDVYITDYSSVVFECSLMERPILFYVYDLEEYGSERGFYYPYSELAPGPVCRNTSELIQELMHIETYDIEHVRQFKDKFMSACDGHATERIISLLETRENL